MNQSKFFFFIIVIFQLPQKQKTSSVEKLMKFEFYGMMQKFKFPKKIQEKAQNMNSPIF